MKYFLTLILLSCIHLAGLSQAGNSSQDKLENGSVFLMRATGFTGSAIAYSVFVDEILICRIKNESYNVHLIAPGIHRFAAQFSGKTQKNNAGILEITIEAGKKYYIQLTVENGILSNKVYCQEITENSAQQLFKRIPEEGCK